MSAKLLITFSIQFFIKLFVASNLSLIDTRIATEAHHSVENCTSLLNLSVCSTVYQPLVTSIKLEPKQSIIFDTECCLYRKYLNCIEDQMRVVECGDREIDSYKVKLYDYLYNFETKCRNYVRGSKTAEWFCPLPHWVWTVAALMLNTALVFAVIYILLCLRQKLFDL